MDNFLEVIGEFETFLADDGFLAAADPEPPDDGPAALREMELISPGGGSERLTDPRRRVDGGAAPMTPPAKKPCPPWRSSEASGAEAPVLASAEASAPVLASADFGWQTQEWFHPNGMTGRGAVADHLVPHSLQLV